MFLPPGHAPLQFHPFANLFPMMTPAELAELCEDITANGQVEPVRLHRGMILDGRNRYEACAKMGRGVTVEPFLGNDTQALDLVFSLNLHRRHLDTSQRAMLGAKLRKLKVGDNQNTVAAQICAGPQLFDAPRAAAPSPAAAVPASPQRPPPAPAPVEARAEGPPPVPPDAAPPSAAPSAVPSKAEPVPAPQPAAAVNNPQAGAATPAPSAAADESIRLSQEQRAKRVKVSRRAQQHADVVDDQGAPALKTAVEQGKVAVSAAAEIARLSFEEQERIVAAADPKVVKKVAKEKRQQKRAQGRDRKLEKMRQATAAPLVTGKKYGVIYVDIPRRFDPWSRETGLEKSPEMHYSTEKFDYLVNLPVRELAAENCALLIYGWQPSLLDQIELMVEYGFASLRPRDGFGRLVQPNGRPLPPVGEGSYRSHMVWGKRASTGNWNRGTGYWWINCHELLMLGVRGDVPCPLEGQQDMSILETVIGEHSAKPDEIRAMIDRYFPGVPKIELFARGDVDRAQWPDWDFWGDEVSPADPPAHLQPGPAEAEPASLPDGLPMRPLDIDVDPEEVAATVTAQSHPRLFGALETVSHDSGSGAGRSGYGVPAQWVEHLALIEAAIAGLTADELEDFAIGEQTASDEIAAGSPALTLAHQLLEAFFNGWRRPERADGANGDGEDLDDDSAITDEFMRDLSAEIAAGRDGAPAAPPAEASGALEPVAGTPCTVVRQATHPHLYRVLEGIAAEGGDHPGHDGYRIPKDWPLAELHRIEMALSRLSPDELNAMADISDVEIDMSVEGLDAAAGLLIQFSARGWAASAVPAGAPACA